MLALVVILPVTSSVVSVPTEVIFGCAAVVSVPAIYWPEMLAVVMILPVNNPLAKYAATLALPYAPTKLPALIPVRNAPLPSI